MNPRSPSLPVSFWFIAIAALVWSLFGVAMFWQNLMLTPDAIAAMPQPNRQLSETMPRWILLPFAVATLGGTFGALCLLLRRRWAVPLLLVSLLALVVQFVGLYLSTPAWALTGPSGAIFPVVLWLIALFLWGYAGRASRRGDLQ